MAWHGELLGDFIELYSTVEMSLAPGHAVKVVLLKNCDKHKPQLKFVLCTKIALQISSIALKEHVVDRTVGKQRDQEKVVCREEAVQESEVEEEEEEEDVVR